MSTRPGREDTVDPLSELEERAIWTTRDIIYVPPSSNSDKLLHLYEDCPRLSKTDPKDKPLDVFPRGYKDICKNCLYRWRNDG